MAGNRRNRGDRRDAIVDAALELFAERGYRGATLAAIAQRAGLTQQGLLHYFPSKEKLLVEVLRLRDERDVEALSHGTDSVSLDGLATLVDLNAQRRGMVQSYTVLSADSVTEEHPAREYFQDRYRRFRRRLAATIRAEHGDALPEGLDADRAAALVIAMMDGLQLQWLLSDEELDMPGLFRTFLGLLGRQG